MTAEAEPAFAKVNLFLHVLGRRPDRRHDLESLTVFPTIGDRLAGEAADSVSLSLDGPFADQLGGGDNVVLRAAGALAARTGGPRGAALKLTKSLPVAAGLGGGSADAAAALRLLSRLWPGVPEGTAGELATTLGADVPACLASRPLMVGGAGEILAAAPAMPAFCLVLANPLQPLPTAEVFAALARRDNPAGCAQPARFADLDDLTSWLAVQRNDLEAPARGLRPVIGQVLDALVRDRRCRLARMSGSGATCFGVYAAESEARAAAEALRRSEPGWWVAAAPVPTEEPVS